ncbi:hypothetical protein VCBJG01_1865, partial [Vibrio cholerae BJG-01]
MQLHKITAFEETFETFN